MRLLIAVQWSLTKSTYLPCESKAMIGNLSLRLPRVTTALMASGFGTIPFCCPRQMSRIQTFMTCALFDMKTVGSMDSSVQNAKIQVLLQEISPQRSHSAEL